LQGALAATAVLVVAGCASNKSLLGERHAVELDGVPFFAQERYQCGPAALATVLNYSGVAVTPEQLVPLVYVPERKGSFQVEIKAATRSFGRLPYEPDTALTALLEEVAGGNPVLVLQNLGLSWLPKWHYAVVIGYDSTGDNLLLRSGTQKRRKESTRRFVRSWQLAGNWAMVALRPGQLPVTASADRYIDMLAASDGRIEPVAMVAALESGLEAWPTDANLLFAAANNARMQSDALAAATFYRRALKIAPTHSGTLNNYADLLREAACLASAQQQITAGLASADSRSPIYPVLQATAGEITAAASAHGATDSGKLCRALTEE
jgi:hypothetical protein